AHPAPRLHAFYRTIEFHGTVNHEPRRKSRSHPKSVGRFDEHAVRADIARVPAKNRRAPLNLEVGAESIALRPPALRTSRTLIPYGHRAAPRKPPAKDFVLRRLADLAAGYAQHTPTRVIRIRQSRACM